MSTQKIDEKIKILVKKALDNGMTIDEIIEKLKGEKR